LIDEKLNFTSVFPANTPEAKAEYRQRYINRRSPPGLINLVMENWDDFISGMHYDSTYCYQVELEKRPQIVYNAETKKDEAVIGFEYLSDVLEKKILKHRF